MEARTSIARCTRLALMMLIIGVGQGGIVGCRSLRNGNPDGKQVRARQLSLRGADLLRRARYGDAQTLFCEAIDSCPTDERAHWGYAATLWEQKQSQAAIAHMQEAVRLSGSNPEYIVRLGEMYLAVGNIVEAEQQARLVLESDHDRADAWALLGDSQAKQSQPQAALESYHRALLIQPDFPRVQLSVADVYRHTGRPHRALATVDRMVDLHPAACAEGEAQLVRGLALIDLGRREEAAIALKSAGSSLSGISPHRQLELVAAHFQLGELVEARMSLGRYLQEFPGDPAGRQLQEQLDHSFHHLAEQPSSPSIHR